MAMGTWTPRAAMRGTTKSCSVGTIATMRPRAIINNLEICDGEDNNCDGQADENPNRTWYRDLDGDGRGDLKRQSNRVRLASSWSPMPTIATTMMTIVGRT